MMTSRDPELKRRIELAEKSQEVRDVSFRILHDPIEDEAATATIIAEVRAGADAQIEPRVTRRRCHRTWAEMKRVLKEEHGLVWYSPREMNPGVMFD